MLFFQINGATWRGNQVILNSSDTKHQSLATEFAITYTHDQVTNANCVTLPLYSNSQRNCLICELNVQTNASREDVILSGAAFVVPDY